MVNVPGKKLLAFDPGGSTGWCRHIFGKELKIARGIESESLWSGGTFTREDHHADLYKFLISEKPDVVVYEAFNYQIRKNKSQDEMPGIQLISREYIGVIRLWCTMTNTPCIKQQPSICGKGAPVWVRDPALKTLGLLSTPTHAERHRNDATRHALYYMVHTLGQTNYLLALGSSRN